MAARHSQSRTLNPRVVPNRNPPLQHSLFARFSQAYPPLSVTASDSAAHDSLSEAASQIRKNVLFQEMKTRFGNPVKNYRVSDLRVTR
ncbi:hypothetical protein HS088_TW13G00616 [Tripterygium wilfordii]|uniref:Uncharacterized protein n=1 Tax=Tripterygium wilfordii TaxID=458696 RepID=A0A7J7CUF5_TRIWF|nr:hypothetical protein HS088_TW13G00616 [Tripterygium wilfordii]